MTTTEKKNKFKYRLKKLFLYFSIGVFALLVLALSIPYLIPVSKASSRHFDKPFSNSEFTIVDGVEIHYRLWENPDSCNADNWILLLHGMGGSTYSWEYNAQALCDSGYNVVAVDIPPFGYSEKSETFNYSIDKRAELLWKFTNRVQLNVKWILIGHSMGGGLSQCMAILKPKQVKKIVFVAPAMFSEIKPGRQFGQYLTTFGPVERIMCVAAEYFYLNKKRINKILESSFAAEVPDSVINEYYKALNNDGFAKAFMRSFSKSNPEKHVNGYDFNTDAIAFFGTKDTWVPYQRTKPITDKLLSIEIIQIEGAGHSIMETHYDIFNKKTIEFLRTD